MSRANLDVFKANRLLASSGQKFDCREHFRSFASEQEISQKSRNAPDRVVEANKIKMVAPSFVMDFFAMGKTCDDPMEHVPRLCSRNVECSASFSDEMKTEKNTRVVGTTAAVLKQ